MKTILFFTISFFFNYASLLQGQFLVNENSFWNNTWIGTEQGDHYHSYAIKFMGDTVINDTTYKKVLQSEDSSGLTWKIVGNILEDGNSRVFYLKDGVKTLLYDFSLEKGDSIFAPNEASYIYAISSSKVKLDNFPDSLKRIDLSFSKDGQNIVASWMEKIGSLSGVLNGIEDIGMVGLISDLVCYFQNGELKYHNTHFSSCFPSGSSNGIDITKGSTARITIRYSYDYIIFDINLNPSKESEFTIYDISGRVIRRYYNGNGVSLEIPKSTLKKGVYVFHFQSNSEYIAGKFIID